MKTHSQLRENRYLPPFILLKHRFILIPDSHKRCIFTPSMKTIFNFNRSLQCHHCITDGLHSDLHLWVTACSIVKLYWASDTAVHGHKAAQYADISRQKAAWAEPRQALSLCVFHWPKTDDQSGSRTSALWRRVVTPANQARAIKTSFTPQNNAFIDWDDPRSETQDTLRIWSHHTLLNWHILNSAAFVTWAAGALNGRALTRGVSEVEAMATNRASCSFHAE